MRILFYHLTRAPVTMVLPRIAERIFDSGERLLVVAEGDALRTQLDKALWSHSADSFLPHAVAGSANDAVQPLLISADPVAANGARHIALADGIWREEALAFERIFHFFDEERIAEARRAWKGLADRDAAEREYWRQGDSGWERVA